MEQLEFYTPLVINYSVWEAKLVQQQKWDVDQELEEKSLLLEALASVGRLAHP